MRDTPTRMWSCKVNCSTKRKQLSFWGYSLGTWFIVSGHFLNSSHPLQNLSGYIGWLRQPFHQESGFYILIWLSLVNDPHEGVPGPTEEEAEKISYDEYLKSLLLPKDATWDIDPPTEESESHRVIRACGCLQFLISTDSTGNRRKIEVSQRNSKSSCIECQHIVLLHSVNSVQLWRIGRFSVGEFNNTYDVPNAILTCVCPASFTRLGCISFLYNRLNMWLITPGCSSSILRSWRAMNDPCQAWKAVII